MIYVMYNPLAGNRTCEEACKGVGDIFASDDKQYIDLLSVGDLEEYIRKLSPEDQIIVCGGDGTMNEVVCGIRDFSLVTLGCLPIGSSNDLTRDLGLPKDHKLMLERILKPEKIVPMDIGCLNYTGGMKRFSVSMGIGFDAAICHEALHSKIKDTLNKIGLGKLTYLGIALKQLASARNIGATIILDDERQIHVDRIMFVTSMIHRYEGGGFMFCPEADYSDGLLDILVVGDISKGKVLAVLPSAMKGTHTKTPGMNTYRAKKVVIRTEEPMPVHVDGESAGIQSEVSVTIETKQVRMIL